MRVMFLIVLCFATACSGDTLAPTKPIPIPKDTVVVDNRPWFEGQWIAAELEPPIGAAHIAMPATVIDDVAGNKMRYDSLRVTLGHTVDSLYIGYTYVPLIGPSVTRRCFNQVTTSVFPNVVEAFMPLPSVATCGGGGTFVASFKKNGTSITVDWNGNLLWLQRKP